jgi:uncharacterized protein
MRIPSVLTALIFAVTALAQPASARDSYVQDGAGLFNASTVSNLNQTIGDFARQTGKEVVVVTVPSLDGQSAQDAAEKVFAQQQVNGVLVFLAKAEKKDGIIGDRASQAFFPAGSFDSIRQGMRGYFRDGDFDQGITTGVSLILAQYRSHERALGTQGARSYVPASSSQSFGGGGMSLIWLILILIAGFLIIRAVFRALLGGPRVMPPGYGGPGYGGPGYGAGYGAGGGGGGSFFSGLLGGLGGAFLGNELFGHQNFGGGFGGTSAGLPGGDSGNAGDAGGWQGDPGQADMGNASFGDFGSSGGGFGDGGGFGGGDGGGFGGGDSGGGW